MLRKHTALLLLALCISSAAALAQSTVKKVLLEEFTTTLCGTCPPKSHEINQFYDTHQGYTVFMTQHAGFGTDSMTNAAASAFASHFQPSTFGFAPAVMIDRDVYPLVDSVPYMSVNGFDTILTTVAAQSAELSLEITGTYDPVSRALNLNVRTHILNCCMIPGDRNVHVFLVEDSVIGSGFRWDQKCYDANWANTHYPGQYNAPTSEILQYPHRHVQRAALTGTWGNSTTIPNQPSGIPGTYYDLPLSYTVPANFNASKLKVVAFAANHGPDKFSKQVLNAEEILVSSLPVTTGIGPTSDITFKSVFPSPATDEVTIDLNITSSGTATLNLYDITGRLITVIEPEQFMTPGRYITRADLSDIPQGTYFIRFEQGSVIRTHKLVKL